ncbi:hypothetical protein K438DRAFT_1943036 [Mycena galopus ATCC 62051]|nr:hypothetical protein K438DRAFT_1943036 [Mycena galopus ATCC 62051]
MARNQEKKHSTFYRFRKAQAVELGLGTRGDSRPRMASACKISVKVAKIQDGVRLFYASSNCISLARRRLWRRSRNSGPTSKCGKPVKSDTTKAKEATDASSSRSTAKLKSEQNADAEKGDAVGSSDD